LSGEALAKSEASGEAGTNPIFTKNPEKLAHLVRKFAPKNPRVTYKKKLPENSFTELPEARHG